MVLGRQQAGKRDKETEMNASEERCERKPRARNTLTHTHTHTNTHMHTHSQKLMESQRSLRLLG